MKFDRSLASNSNNNGMNSNNNIINNNNKDIVNNNQISSQGNLTVPYTN